MKCYGKVTGSYLKFCNKFCYLIYSIFIKFGLRGYNPIKDQINCKITWLENFTVGSSNNLLQFYDRSSPNGLATVCMVVCKT